MSFWAPTSSFIFVPKCVSHHLLYLKCLGFPQHSTPSPWQCQSQLSGCPNRESQKHCIPINKCSISAAFMWFERAHKRLDCQGTWTDGTKQCRQVKQYAVIQARGTNPHNEPCIPMCINYKVQPHKANYWLSFSFFPPSPAVNAAHFLQGDKQANDAIFFNYSDALWDYCFTQETPPPFDLGNLIDARNCIFSHSKAMHYGLCLLMDAMKALCNNIR